MKVTGQANGTMVVGEITERDLPEPSYLLKALVASFLAWHPLLTGSESTNSGISSRPVRAVRLTDPLGLGCRPWQLEPAAYVTRHPSARSSCT